MDLEHLTKHQILLLTLLVSFVTSIATGIVTVALMDQAPAGVTRVINQIVERTVDTVTPSDQGAAAATTVVIKDDDLAAQSIAQVQQSIVRIVERGSDQLLTRGILVDAKGLAIADRAALAATGDTVFDALLASGERVPAVMRSDSSGTFALLDVVVGTSTFSPAVLGSASDLKLGQSVIRIGGTGADTVGVGVIARLSSSGTEGAGSTLEASVDAATSGSILMTLFGEIIGMTTAVSQTAGTAFYTPLDGNSVSGAPAEPSSP